MVGSKVKSSTVWWRTFSLNKYDEVEMMQKTGFYIIKDKFFEDMSDPNLKGNKSGNRPHYYCLKDEEEGIYWMIPLSSRIDKYKDIIKKRLARKQPCDIIHIAKLDNDKESAFLIQDMFPVTEEYVEREYTIAGNHLKLTSEHVVREVERKANKVYKLLKNGVVLNPTQPKVMRMLEMLKNK